MPSCRPRFIRAIASALLVASLGAHAPDAISAEPLIQELCDILRHPDAKIDAEELKRRLDEEFEDNFISQIDSLAEGDLSYLALELAELPGSAWTDLIPRNTTPGQRDFFSYVQTLLESGAIPDHVGEAIREGQSPDRIHALQRAINLSVEVLLGKRKPENATKILQNLLKALPSERIHDVRGHTEKIDREALFLKSNPQKKYFDIIDPQTQQIDRTDFKEYVHYSGESTRVARVELINSQGQVIFQAPLDKELNQVTNIEEKKTILPVVKGAMIRITLTDGSQFHQKYFDFHPNFPVRPLIANKKISGGHLTEDIENFIATYSDFLTVVKSPPQTFMIVGQGRNKFTLRQYEISFRSDSKKPKIFVKTTFDSAEIAAKVEKVALDKLKRIRIPKNKGIPTQTINLEIILRPDPRPDGSIPPWTINGGKRAWLPYVVYLRRPQTLNRSSTSYPKPITLKRPYHRKKKRAQ